MKGYGQFCPMAKAAEVIGGRWTVLILRELICGASRFNEIRRGVPLVSPSLLAQRLRELEAAGVIRREGAASYHLTEAGPRGTLSRRERCPQLTNPAKVLDHEFPGCRESLRPFRCR